MKLELKSIFVRAVSFLGNGSSLVCPQIKKHAANLSCKKKVKMENFDLKQLTVVSSNEMVVDGVILREEKHQKTLENDEGDQSKKVEIFHKKTIGDRMYSVTVIVTDGKPGEKKVDTNIKEDELKAFEDEWNQLWQPCLKDCDH